MPNQFLPDSSPQIAPYLVLLPSQGPLSARTAPGGNTPEFLGSGEGAHLGPVPSAHPEAGRDVAGGLVGGARRPWPRALVFRQLGTGAPVCGGNLDPGPWVRRGRSARKSCLSRWGNLSQPGAGLDPTEFRNSGTLKAQH